MAEQLAFPGMGPNRKLQSPRSELPSRNLSKLQFHFRVPGYMSMDPPAPKQLQKDAYWGSGRNEVYAVERKTGKSAGYLGYRSVPNTDWSRWESHGETGREPGGEIMMIETEPQYQRSGVASHMWDFAHEMASKLTPDRVLQPRLFRAPRRKRTGNKWDDPAAPIQPPVHSSSRTDMGEAWARKVGGFTPPRSGYR